MKELIKAAAIRAGRTALDYIIGSIPGGLIITPAMIENFNKHEALVAFAAWLITGLVACATAFFQGIKFGLPEVDPAEADDAYEDDVEPVTMEELDELDNDIEDTENEEK